MGRFGLLALLAIAALGAGAGWLDSQIDRPYRGHRPEKVFVDIPRGTSRWGVSGILGREDVIRSRLAFEVFSTWHFRRHLQAGEYLFDQPLDSREVFWKIARGKIYIDVVTVPEGWNRYDIAREVEQHGLCARADFLRATGNTALIADIAPRAPSLEGFLFPSTYEFTRHSSCAQIVGAMVSHFRSVWQQVSGPTAPSELTSVQVVTLASLVERETPVAEERPLVAGVFYNRLRRGYLLQCDPTVQYAQELAGNPTRDVRPEDLRIISPYNTYEHRGLPPGPIANPGEASLRAALAPASTDYLYFVANNAGGHFFGRTLAEHNQNVARLRRALSGKPVQGDPPSASTR